MLLTCYLFASAPFAVLPIDMDQRVVLAALDVCGASAQTARLVKNGHTVVILGAGGKSGLLSLAEVYHQAGVYGQVIAVEQNEEVCEQIRQLGIAHQVLCVDATKPVEVLVAITKVTGGELADVTINCVNVSGTEFTSIVVTREQGTVYFFSMAVQFTTAALGAEGIGKDVQLMIGNGYTNDHAEHTLKLLRSYPELMDVFIRRYSSHL